MTINETLCLYNYLQGRTNVKVLVDVGAHFGGDIVPFLKDGYQVHAFEPDPSNREVLLRLCDTYPNLSIDSRAVTNKTRTAVPFFTSSVSTGISGLAAFHPSHRATTEVGTVTLGDFCSAQAICSVDFLKIDTEGFDLFVLEGYPWERSKPTVVICEFEDRKTMPLGYTYHDLARFLKEKGYEVLVSDWYPIVEYGAQHTWRDFRVYPCELGDPQDWGNLLAFRDGIDWPHLLSAVARSCQQGTPADCGQVDTEVRDLREQLKYLSNSVSWRLTAPLRSVLKMWRKLGC